MLSWTSSPGSSGLPPGPGATHELVDGRLHPRDGGHAPHRLLIEQVGECGGECREPHGEAGGERAMLSIQCRTRFLICAGPRPVLWGVTDSKALVQRLTENPDCTGVFTSPRRTRSTNVMMGVEGEVIRLPGFGEFQGRSALNVDVQSSGSLILALCANIAMQ